MDTLFFSKNEYSNSTSNILFDRSVLDELAKSRDSITIYLSL